MALFAEYEPARKGWPTPASLLVRAAERADVDALSALRVERGDATPEEARIWFARRIARSREGDALLVAASVEGTVVGYGNADHLSPGSAPQGWYLGGVVVAPKWRRRGIASALTRARLAWIAERASRAYYFTNARNLPSIDLHARFGFEEIDPDVHIPGVTFHGGVGRLYRVELAAPEAARR